MIIDIFVPTLNKRDITAMLSGISRNSRLPHVVHLTSEGKSYAQAVNLLYSRLHTMRHSSDYFFCGADDLMFYEDWDVNAMIGGNAADVIGTNDLHNPYVLKGKHATHYFVRYGYIAEHSGTGDRSYPVLYDYMHNYTDAELVETAKKRGAFCMALSSKVEHIHPAFNLRPMDDGYHKSYNTSAKDRLVFLSRRHLWDSPDSCPY